MKQKLLFILGILMSYCADAQHIYFPYDIYPEAEFWTLDSVNFEIQSNVIVFDSGALWQIGISQKTVLNQSWSPPNCLITDTLLPYPDSVNTFFYLKFKPWESNNVFIAWNQRVDVGSGDSCLVEISSDGSQWMSLTEYFDYIGGVSWLFELIYYKTDLNTNISEFGAIDEDCEFIDTTSGWTQQSLWFHYMMPVKEDNKLFTDSMFVRFRFSSDENTDIHEGWLIDNFYMGDFVIGSSIENFSGTLEITVFPNPAEDELRVICNDCKYPMNMSVIDMAGKLVSKEMIDKPVISIQHLDAGFYFLVFEDYTGLQAKSKVIKVR